MKPRVVIAYDEFPDVSVEQVILNALDAEVLHIRALMTPEQFDAAATADALMVTIQHVSGDLVGRMNRCRIISRVGTGLDAIDIPAATARGIWVTNVPDYSVDEVSTHAIALLLALARRLPQLLEATRQGIWDSKRVRPFDRLKGQTLGLVGFGRIARAVASKGQGLGLRALAYDPYIESTAIAAANVQPVDLESLMRDSDFVSLHVPLTASTRQMINAQTLIWMKPSAFLINTARGPLIDEDALLDAVRSRKIAGAALDVLAIEPPAANHPLLHQEQIIVTPHIGWYSEAANHDVRVRGAEEVVRVLRGQRPQYPVNEIESPNLQA